MEILKSENIPTLITNMEVMYMLSNKIKERQNKVTPDETATLHNNSSSNNSQNNNNDRRRDKFQHRDYIEEKVVEYIRHTACGFVDEAKLQRMPKLISKLERKPMGKHQKSKRTSLPNGENHHENGKKSGENGNKELNGYHPMNGNDENNHENEEEEREEEDGFGLTDGETLQILNLVPRESVEIHLIIEDLSRRLSEARQEDLLKAISETCVDADVDVDVDVDADADADADPTNEAQEEEQEVGDEEMEYHGDDNAEEIENQDWNDEMET